jgi:hypothetical protein
MPKLAGMHAPTLQHIETRGMQAPKKLPPRRQHRRRPRAAATATSASVGTSPGRAALQRLRDGGPAALRAAIVNRILLEPPPGLRKPQEALPELPLPPLRTHEAE